MSEAAVLDKPDEWNQTQHIYGPPRGQLWDHYAVLFHPIEQAIKEAEKRDGPYRQTWKHQDVALPGEREYSVYAWRWTAIVPSMCCALSAVWMASVRRKRKSDDRRIRSTPPRPAARGERGCSGAGAEHDGGGESATRKAPIKVKAGDRVLIGKPGISMPSDWFMATVLWADDIEMLTQHEPTGRIPPLQRQVLDIEYVRAVGDGGTLAEFKKEACEAVETEQRKVRELESELGRARDAVWAKLDELAADVKVLETTNDD